MHELLQVGTFPTLSQNLIDSEFRCHSRQDLERDDVLRNRVRGIITRSNFAVPQDAIATLPNPGIIAACRRQTVSCVPDPGSATDETRLAMARLTMDNLHCFFANGTTLTPIDAAMQA